MGGPNGLKGKTLEQVFGVEKAQEIRKRKSANYTKNFELKLESEKEQRAQLLIRKACTRCKVEKDGQVDFPKDSWCKGGYSTICRVCSTKYAREWGNRNKERRNETNKRSNQKLRREVLAAYGNRCTCCGETEQDFLAIDHKDGGGNIHIKKLHKQGMSFTSWLSRNNYPEGFQILCHNCNWSKWVNKGKCIHQIKKGV